MRNMHGGCVQAQLAIMMIFARISPPCGNVGKERKFEYKFLCNFRLKSHRQNMLPHVCTYVCKSTYYICCHCCSAAPPNCWAVHVPAQFLLRLLPVATVLSLTHSLIHFSLHFSQPFFILAAPSCRFWFTFHIFLICRSCHIFARDFVIFFHFFAIEVFFFCFACLKCHTWHSWWQRHFSEEINVLPYRLRRLRFSLISSAVDWDCFVLLICWLIAFSWAEWWTQVTVFPSFFLTSNAVSGA